MVKVAGRGEDDIAAVKTVVVVSNELIAIETAHCLPGAQNGQTQRMILPEGLCEEFGDQHVRIVFVDLDLFKYYAAFALDIGIGKERVEH